MSCCGQGSPVVLRLVPTAEAGTLGDVTVLDQGDHTLVILHDDIDFRIAHELEQAGSFCLEARRPVVVDARKATLIDSVGVSFIVWVAAGLRSRGSELVVQGPCQRLAELLTTVGADPLVRWLPDQPLVRERP